MNIIGWKNFHSIKLLFLKRQTCEKTEIQKKREKSRMPVETGIKIPDEEEISSSHKRLRTEGHWDHYFCKNSKFSHQSHFQSKSDEKACNYNYAIHRETSLIRLRSALSGLLLSINNSSLMSQRFPPEEAHLSACYGWTNGCEERLSLMFLMCSCCNDFNNTNTGK